MSTLRSLLQNHACLSLSTIWIYLCDILSRLANGSTLKDTAFHLLVVETWINKYSAVACYEISLSSGVDARAGFPPAEGRTKNIKTVRDYFYLLTFVSF